MGSDGKLHCGECGAVLEGQIVFSLLGEERRIDRRCPCINERFKRMDEARERRESERKLQSLRAAAFPFEDLSGQTFAADDGTNPKLMDIARNYARDFGNTAPSGVNGLLLFGEVGTGKSFAAACIVNELLSRGIEAIMCGFSLLVNEIFGKYEDQNERLTEYVREPALLVLDDFGAERSSSYMDERVFTIIDTRVRSGRPFIITTNLSGNELKYPADIGKRRVYSRILGACFPFEVRGMDRRKERLKRDFEAVRDRLE